MQQAVDPWEAGIKFKSNPVLPPLFFQRGWLPEMQADPLLLMQCGVFIACWRLSHRLHFHWQVPT